MNAREGICDTLLSDSYWEPNGVLEMPASEREIATIDVLARVASSATSSVQKAFKALSAENAHYMHEVVHEGQLLPTTDTDKVSLLRIVMDERRRYEAPSRKTLNDLGSRKNFDHRAGQIEAIRWFQYNNAEHEMAEDGVVTAVRKAVVYAQSTKSIQRFACVPAPGIVKKDLIDTWHETKGIAPESSFSLPVVRVGEVYRMEQKGQERLLRVAQADLFSSYKANESDEGGGTLYCSASLSSLWRRSLSAMPSLTL